MVVDDIAVTRCMSGELSRPKAATDVGMDILYLLVDDVTAPLAVSMQANVARQQLVSHHHQAQYPTWSKQRDRDIRNTPVANHAVGAVTDARQSATTSRHIEPLLI